MDISSYLKILLKTQKKVGIPGLGTIYKQKVAGRYDSDTHIFIPPRYELYFTREILESSLLRDYICKKRSISPESADYFISGLTEDISTQIELNNQGSLGDLGTITKQDDHWIIQSKGNDSVDFGFYGLPAINESLQEQSNESFKSLTHPSKENEHKIESEPLAAVQESPSPSQSETEQQSLDKDDQEIFEEISEYPATDYSSPVQEIPYVETDVAEIESDAVEQNRLLQEIETSEASVEGDDIPYSLVEETKEENRPQEIIESGTANIWHFDRVNYSTTDKNNAETSDTAKRRLANWQKLLIIFAGLAALLAALYLIKPSIFKTTPKKVIKTGVVKSSPIPKIVAPDSIPKIDTLKAIALTIDTLKDIVSVDSATTWEIMCASLTKKEVKQYIAEMKARGYTAKAIPGMPGKRIKISIATFSNEKSAKEGREILVKKLKNKDLYIYQNKHTHK